MSHFRNRPDVAVYVEYRDAVFSGYGDELGENPLINAAASGGMQWWQPLVGLVNLLVLGFIARRALPWKPHYTSLIRRGTFNILLPCYVLRSIWVVTIDGSMYDISLVSFIFHIVQALFWCAVYWQVGDRQTRGWLLMTSQGCLISFLYSGMSNHSKFGEKATAVCLLWDIGGNMWVAQGLLWALAAYYAPQVHEMKKLDAANDIVTTVDDVDFTVTTANRDREAGGGENDLYHRTTKEDCLDSNSTTATSDEENATERSLFMAGKRREWGGRSSSQLEQENGPSALNVLKAVICQPILPAFIAGLFLNSCNVACPEIIGSSLEATGALFKPFLYFLVGLHSEIITDAKALRIVATAVLVRFLFAGVAAVMLWLWLPFGPLERTTIALGVLAPASTMTMYLVAEFGYPQKFATMSAFLTLVSVFISFTLQEVVMSLF